MDFHPTKDAIDILTIRIKKKGGKLTRVLKSLQADLG
jgi:hypothetical protein